MPNGGVVRTYADVSELVRAKVAAEAGERAKASFVATMSHEIRTPMNGVLGMIDLIEETPLTAQQRRYVATIRSSGEALVALINDVLDFSKLEAGQMQIERRPFAAIPLVETVFDILEASAAKAGVALRLLLGPGLGGTFFGDPTRVRQILLNLCGNAVKFTRRGSVELRLTAKAAEDGRQRLRFEVADTGVGVPEAMRHRLFREFSQVDASVTRKFGGTGLGLTICKRLVEAMGGAIDFESQEGVGSVFWFEIPTTRAEAPSPPAASARARIVSDDARAREAALSLLPYVGLSAGDDADAEVALVDASGPEAPSEFAEIERNAQVRVIVFGLDAWRLGARVAATIDGALTPARLARALAAASIRHDAAKSAGAGAATPAPSERKLRALVAEDHPISREVLARLLQRMGHETIVAEDGRQAVDRVVESDFDVVFMDVQMPEMDGLEATRRIRALGGEKARTPIVAMTASALDSDRAACLEAGMDGYLSKPVGRDKLAAALAQIALRRA
jgi:CheY-like chemotaxis protein/nitrogen-specific signal transduction histidine kinase